MGITDLFSDICTALSFQELHAEAQEEEEDNQPAEEKEEGGEEEEEEEEEEEPEDIKPKLEEECANSATCSTFKHHYDDCVARVTAAEDNGDSHGPQENCVEEFFHLQHCATQCAAPKLWKALK